jgi:translation initiation factor 2 subunit 2
MESVTADMGELSFDPTMKKKKSSARKKSVAFEEPSTAEGVPETNPSTEAGIAFGNTNKLIVVVGENEEDMFAGKKKKAKKILLNAGDGDEDAAEPPAEEGDDLDFSNLKKKKKKRADVAAFEAKLEEAGIVDDKEAEVEGDDPFTKGEGDEATVEEGQDEEEAWLKSDRDYTYEEVRYLL